MYQTLVMRLRNSTKPSNKDFDSQNVMTQTHMLKANSLLEKAKSNCINSDQNEIDLKEISLVYH